MNEQTTNFPGAGCKNGLSSTRQRMPGARHIVHDQAGSSVHLAQHLQCSHRVGSGSGLRHDRERRAQRSGVTQISTRLCSAPRRSRNQLSCKLRAPEKMPGIHSAGNSNEITASNLSFRHLKGVNSCTDSALI